MMMTVVGRGGPQDALCGQGPDSQLWRGPQDATCSLGQRPLDASCGPGRGSLIPPSLTRRGRPQDAICSPGPGVSSDTDDGEDPLTRLVLKVTRQANDDNGGKLEATVDDQAATAVHLKLELSEMELGSCGGGWPRFLRDGCEGVGGKGF